MWNLKCGQGVWVYFLWKVFLRVCNFSVWPWAHGGFLMWGPPPSWLHCPADTWEEYLKSQKREQRHRAASCNASVMGHLKKTNALIRDEGLTPASRHLFPFFSSTFLTSVGGLTKLHSFLLILCWNVQNAIELCWRIYFCAGPSPPSRTCHLE